MSCFSFYRRKKLLKTVMNIHANYLHTPLNTGILAFSLKRAFSLATQLAPKTLLDDISKESFRPSNACSTNNIIGKAPNSSVS